MATYAQVYRRIVEKFSETIGEVAVTQAKTVSSVELDEDLTPNDEITKEEIEKLIEQYEVLMKKGAIGIAREAVREEFKEDKTIKDLKLPDEIVPKEVKADQFASAL